MSQALFKVSIAHVDQDATSFPNQIRRDFIQKPPTVLCLILTTAQSIEKQKAVNSTWVKRCDKALFLLGKGVDRTQPRLRNPAMLEIDVTESRQRLPEKVQKAFKFAYENHIDSFDWILKCDDDTYVIMENLKLLLSKLKPTEPSYIGFRMKPFLTHGYMSGGAGYLISSSGLRKVIKTGYQTQACNISTGFEDVEMAKCFEASGLRIINSWDEQGKELFHPESLRSHLYPPYPEWVSSYAWKEASFGPGCCSRHAVSFHHLSSSDMFVYEALLYDIDVVERRNEDGK